MEDLGFIVVSYVLSLGGTAVLAFAYMRRAKKLNPRINPEDKHWT